MEFNRNGQARPTNTPSASPTPVQATQRPAAPAAASELKHSKFYRMSFLALLISGTILFIAMIFFIVFGTPLNREAKFVNNDQYQAVFVNVNGTNGGQVYFGRITSLTPQYIRLTNVFYIQNQSSDTQASSGSSYNLVKLGCELHGPVDEMLINRDQVFFWENLKADSQVAQKAAEFYKQNPNGQKCTANSGSTDQSSGSTQTPATSTGATTAPATTTAPAAGSSTTNTTKKQ